MCTPRALGSGLEKRSLLYSLLSVTGIKPMFLTTKRNLEGNQSRWGSTCGVVGTKDELRDEGIRT